MICSKCGKTLSDDLYYCDNCGEPTGKSDQWAPINNNQNTNTYSDANQNPYNTGTYNRQNQYQPPNEGPYQNPYGNNNYNSYNSYNNYNANNGFKSFENYAYFNEKQKVDKKIEDSRLLGILGIILGLFITSILGIILGAIGLSKLNEIPYEFQNECAQEREKAKKLNIAGIVAPICVRIVIWVGYFLLVVGVFTAMQ